MWLAEVSHRAYAPQGVSSLYKWSTAGADKKDLMGEETFGPIS